jgi:hypothetical protein
MDPTALALAAEVESLIQLGAATSPRSLQPSVGASEVGAECDRRMSYRMRGVPPTNQTDPLRALVGLGGHLALAELFTRLGSGTGRFLVEQRIVYRGLPGTCDLFDRYRHVVIDWKMPTLSRLKKYKIDGVPRHYSTQVQVYGAGLTLLGERVDKVAVCFLPVDGQLSDLWAWISPYDVRIADDAIERLERLRGVRPEDATPTPSRLCGWCDNFLPNSTNIAAGCPGMTEGKQ